MLCSNPYKMIIYKLFVFIYESTPKYDLFMATILPLPDNFSPPTLVTGRLDEYERLVDAFKASLSAHCRDFGAGVGVGEVIRFRVKEGCAQYMVVSLRRTELVHLPLGDCHRLDVDHERILTAETIAQQLVISREIHTLFGC